MLDGKNERERLDAPAATASAADARIGWPCPSSIGNPMTGIMPATTGQPRRTVSFATKMGYGFGAVAYGIKDNGFAVFLLIYYNQVVGMPAGLVGLAVLIALLADACFDPLVGHFSDRTRSRWGRRHPWLYGAILPITLTWLLLWNPPASGNAALFGYLILVAMMVRFAFSAYEVPTLAILPELTHDYDERTEVLRYRFLFGWAGGLVMLFLAYRVLLVPDADQPNGLLNADGYHAYGIVGALIMLIAVSVSALATHRLVARPTHETLDRAQQPGSLRESFTTLAFRPFLILLVAGVFAFANQGLLFALTNYLLLFVWRFPQAAFSLYPFALFGGVVAAFLLVGPLGRRYDKHRLAAVSVVIAVVIGTAPYWLRVFGSLAGDGSNATVAIVLGLLGVSTAFAIMAMILITAMVADVTDASEVRTGKRTEGLFFAGFFFMQKCVGGLGILLSSLLLTLAGFPEAAAPETVPIAVLDRLAIGFAIATTAIGLACAYAFWCFPLGRCDHAARLAELALAETVARRSAP